MVAGPPMLQTYAAFEAVNVVAVAYSMDRPAETKCHLFEHGVTPTREFLNKLAEENPQEVWNHDEQSYTVFRGYQLAASGDYVTESWPRACSYFSS